MRNNLFVSLLVLLTICSAGRINGAEPLKAVGRWKGLRETAKSYAHLPDKKYSLYCLENNRDQVLAIPTDLDGGWSMAKDKFVAFDRFNLLSSAVRGVRATAGTDPCAAVDDVVNKDDQIEIKKDDQANFVLVIKRHGTTNLPDIPLVPGKINDDVVWLQTAKPANVGANLNVNYFVYIEDDRDTVLAMHWKTYRIEGFVADGPQKCLDHQPTIAQPAKAVVDCGVGVLSQNGTGVGTEPK